MKLKPLVLILFLFINILVNCQSKNDTISNKDKARTGNNYFGINLGTTTGIGLSYIYWPAENGIQITFIPLIDKDNSYFSFGATYLHTIKSYTNSDFFLYWGNHLTNMFTNKPLIYNTGVGPGVHYYINDFVIHFMIGYGIYSIPTNIMTRPTVEFGTFYKF